MKKSLLFIAVIAAFCSCSKDEVELTSYVPEVANGKTTILANTSSTDTRTTLGGNSYREVTWAESDKIKMLYQSATPVEYSIKSRLSENKQAIFTGDEFPESSEGKLIFTYGSAAYTYADNTLTASFTCPATQNYVANSVTDGTMAMIGQSNSNNSIVGFKQVYSILRITITSNQKKPKALTNITVSGLKDNYYTFDGSNLTQHSAVDTKQISYTVTATPPAVCNILIPAGSYLLDEVTIDVTQSAGGAQNYPLKKDFTFEPGHIYPFSIQVQH